MNFLTGFVSYLFHRNIEDLEGLRRELEESPWTTRCVVPLYQGSKLLFVNTTYSICLSLFSLLRLKKDLAFSYLSHGISSGRLALAYTITLLPNFIAFRGLSLIELCKRYEAYWLLRISLHHLEDTSSLLKELDETGYLSIELVHRYHVNYRSSIYGSDPLFYLNQMISSAIRALPPEAIGNLEMKSQGPLIGNQSSSEGNSKNEVIEELFSVIHGDFTGNQLTPPQTADLVQYLLDYINKVSPELKTLTSRLETIQRLEQARKDSKGDYQAFAAAVIKELEEKKVISLPSGYSRLPSGHRTYITLTLEGDQISGRVINFGEGAEETSTLNTNSSVRIFPEQILKKASKNVVQNSYFWKVFLDLLSSVAPQGSRDSLSIEDFNKTLLSEWPGGVGAYQKKDKKPQYSGTCQFVPLRYIIHQVLGDEDYKPFMLGLYLTSLEDYVEKGSLTAHNLFAIEAVYAHVARMFEKLKDQEKINQGLETFVKRLDAIKGKIATFKETQKQKMTLFPLIQCDTPLYDQDVSYMPLTTSNFPSSNQLPLNNPPNGDLKKRLEYYIQNGRSACVFKDMAQGLCYYRKGFEELPPIDDPFWNNQLEDLHQPLIDLVGGLYLSALSSKKKMDGGASEISPDDAALLFKGYWILFNLAARELNRPEITQFFLGRMKTVFQAPHALYLLRPTRPDVMAEFAKVVNAFQKAPSHKISVQQNVALMSIELKNLNRFDDYPHLQYIHEVLQQIPGCQITMDRYIRGITKNHFVTPGNQIAYTYAHLFTSPIPGLITSPIPEPAPLKKMVDVWRQFFGLFGTKLIQKGAQEAKESFLDHGVSCDACYEVFYFQSSNGNDKRVLSIENIDKQTDLFIDTYPNLSSMYRSHLLTPALKKEIPFNNQKKDDENEHLLVSKSLNLGNDNNISRHEVKELFGITNQRKLSIHLLVDYFDHYFFRLKLDAVQSLFQAFLNEVFFDDEGKLKHLLSDAAKNDPIQMEYLSSFFQRKRENYIKIEAYDHAISFLFWMEGVVLSHWIFVNPNTAEDAYAKFLEMTKRLFNEEQGSEKLRKDISLRLVSLLPYFEKTVKYLSFKQLVFSHVPSIPIGSELPVQENRRLSQGIFISQNPNWRTKQNGVIRIFNGQSYTNTKNRATFSHKALDKNGRFDFFQWESNEEGVFYKKDEKVPYCYYANRNVILLEGEKQTDLILVNNVNHELVDYLQRLSVSTDIFVWKNKTTHQLTRIDYFDLNLSFHFENDPSQKNSGVWMSSLHPGYFIDPNPTALPFEPFSHYIVLRNKEGKRLVYIPSAPFEKRSTDQTLTKLNNTFIDKEKISSLLFYPLDQNEAIDFTHLRHEEILYSLYLAMQKRDYDAVTIYLKKWTQERLLHSEETVKVLDYFYQMEDKSPWAVIIRIKLSLSLLNDPLYQLSEGEKQRFTIHLFEDMLFYNGQKNNTFPFFLSEDEQKKLAGHVPTLKRFFIEQKMERAIALEMQRAKEPKSNYEAFDLSKEAAQTEPPATQNSLRPEHLTTHFLSYYQLAKSSDQKKREALAFLLRACKMDLSQEVQCARIILQSVLKYPYYFPSVNAIIKLQEAGEKNAFILTKLYQIAKGPNFTSTPSNLSKIIYSVLKVNEETITLFALYFFAEKLFESLLSKTLNLAFPSLFSNRWFQIITFYPRYWIVQKLLSVLTPSFSQHKQTLLDLTSRIWTLRSNTRLLEPATYQTEFTPEISLSQMGPLIDVKKSRFIVEGKYDYAEDLTALDEMEKVFEVKAKEPCIQRKRERFLKGIEAKKVELKEKNQSIQYKIDPTQISLLIAQLEQNDFQHRYEEEEQKIFAIAHRFEPALRVQVHGDLITPLSLNELIIAFGRKDHAKILKSNPSLTEGELKNLEEAIGEYLLYKIAFDRAQKGLKLLQKAQNETEENQDRLLSQALDILSAERKFDPSQNPHLLVFEYFMELTLRENQVQFLKNLVASQKLKNILQEAHTGFGKSKVAIPLWLFLTSQSGRLTLITTPEPLLEEMRIHLKKVLGQTFDQQIIRLDFDRTQSNDLNYLKYLNGLLSDAKKEGKCVVLSINALHGLAVLKRKEAYLKALENNLPPGYFEELDKIKGHLDSASNFVDEASECFYSRYSFDYSVGRKKPIERNYIRPIRKLYERLLDEAMQKVFHFDFLPVKERQEYITPEVYREEIRPYLIKKIIAWFKIPEHFKAAARASLSGKDHEESEAFFRSLSKDKLKEFAIIQSFLVSHLEQGLTCRWNERYRLGSDRIAYPARNGKLIPRSQFSSIDLIIAFTLQANLKTPFEYQHIEEFINHLIEEELTQSSQKFKASTPYQLFAKMSQGLNIPQNLHDLGEKEKRILLDRLNQSIELRLLFTEEYVLPKLTFFPQKIVSLPQLVCNRIGHTQGASGTMHENVPESFDVRFEDKTIFNNLLPLWKHSQDALKSIPKLEGPPLIDYLFNNCGAFNVIIDVAGYLRGFSSNEAIAREILENTPKTIEAVGFIDEGGRSMILARGLSTPVLRSNTSIDLDKIFMFYSQEAVVGFDIELPAHAKALVTVGRETKGNLFMQGVGRLRGLQSGMHASFVTIEEELKKIRSMLNLPENYPVQFKDLFLYVFDLESEKQGEEAFTVVYNECLAQIEEIFWKQELKMSKNMRLEQFKKIKSLQCTETFVHPVHFLRRSLTTVDINAAINQAVESLLAPIKKVGAQGYDVKALEASFRNRFNNYKERFPLEYKGRSETSDLELSFSEVEIEQEQESEKELDLEREINLDRDSSLYFSPAKPEQLGDYWDLTQYEKVSTFHPEHKQFISDNLLCTKNFFKIATNNPELHRKTMKPAHFFLVIQNKEESTYRIVLLDLYDAGSIYEQMKKGQRAPDTHYNYYFIGTNDLTCLASNGKDPWSLEIQEDPKFREVLLESRPYTGMFSLDASELKTLEESGKKSPFLQSVKERFERVFPHYSRQIEKYGLNQ